MRYFLSLLGISIEKKRIIKIGKVISNTEIFLPFSSLHNRARVKSERRRNNGAN